MKTRRFSEIDLAKFVALAGSSRLESALLEYRLGGGFWSYDPVRSSTADIVGAITPLHGAVGRPSWNLLERQISSACKQSDDQVAANVSVGKVLFDQVEELALSAVKFQMGRMPIGSGESVCYWSDVVLADTNGPFIPFFDHRRDHGISVTSREVVFAMQNAWVRERHPDLAQARLAVVKFPSSLHGRTMRIDFHSGQGLMSFDDLDAKVRTVYEGWERILKEKDAPKRKVASGQGDFFA